jgi:peptidoglycan/LPS O-acetylase OafA/YrhL
MRALSSARAEERVRGILALLLVGYLIALVFATPGGNDAEPAIASAKTLAIAVLAFYFGLHGATPHRNGAAGGKSDGKGIERAEP